MQLKEMKMLVEYGLIESFMVVKHGGGWSVMAFKKSKNGDITAKESSLELARGGIRVFKTLDAVYSLFDTELSSFSFTVC